ncbi:MAG: type II secretion system protein [Phycisphaeraceae bacterium]
MATRKANKGFTLVEILIVVVILGILAAIVIPQFTSASESARASSTVSQLQAIRSQLELAQVDHLGEYPDLVANGWDEMTQETERDYSTETDDSGNEEGPYMRKPPVNAFTGTANVVASGTTPTTSDGWVYDKATGEILAVVPAGAVEQHELDANDVVELEE